MTLCEVGGGSVSCQYGLHTPIEHNNFLSVHFISEPHTQSTDNSISPIRNRKRSEDIRVSPGNNHNEYYTCCPECDNTFRSNQGLALHPMIHTLTEPDIC